MCHVPYQQVGDPTLVIQVAKARHSSKGIEYSAWCQTHITGERRTARIILL